MTFVPSEKCIVQDYWSNHSSKVFTFPKSFQFNMMFTRVVTAVFVAAISAQALYIPEVLHAREFSEFSELSERGLEPSTIRNDIAARDFIALEDDVLVTRGDREGTPPVPYECTNKAQCDQHIHHANYQIAGAQEKVDHWSAKKSAATKGTKEYRTGGEQSLICVTTGHKPCHAMSQPFS